MQGKEKAGFFPLIFPWSLHEKHQTRIQEFSFFRAHVLVNSLSSVDIMCIDTVPFTLWKLCRIMVDIVFKRAWYAKGECESTLNCKSLILSRDWFVWQSSRKKIAMDKNFIYSNCCDFKNERKEVHSNCTLVTFEPKKKNNKIKKEASTALLKVALYSRSQTCTLACKQENKWRDHALYRLLRDAWTMHISGPNAAINKLDFRILSEKVALKLKKCNHTYRIQKTYI